MHAQVASIVWFAVGVVLQALFVIRIDRNSGALEWGLLAACMAFSAVGLIPSKGHVHVSPADLLECIAIFGFCVAVLFQKAILPVINEKIVLSYTLVFWYALFVNFQRLDLPDWMIYASLVPTGATLLIAFTQPQLAFPWKAAMYAWFLVLIVSLALMQFSFGRLAIFYSPQQAPWLSPIECLTMGMAFLYLCVNGTFVFELIPLPGRNESWRSRMRDWHALTELMAYRFIDLPSAPIIAAAIFVIEGGLLVLNYLYHFIPDGLLINLLLVLPGILYFSNRVSPPASTVRKAAE
jgi:hypothetical protein